MEELVVYSVTVEVLLGEDLYFFSGVSSESLDKAQERAVESMRETEYLDCVKFRLIATHYGIL